MIEMNVTQKNMTNIVRVQAGLAKSINDILERRFRPGIEQDQSLVRFECSGGDDAGSTQLSSVENVDHRNLATDKHGLTQMV